MTGAGRRRPVAYVRVVARLRARGHTLEEIKRASDKGQLAVGPIESLLDTQEGRYTLKEAAREAGLDAGADRTDLRGLGPGRAVAGHALRRGPRDHEVPAAVLTAGLPGGGLPAAAARVRAGDRPDRGRRGAPVSPVRPRAAHAQGRARRADRRGDGGAHARNAALRRALHELPARALSGALRRAGRDRPHGGRPRARRPPRRGDCASRSRSPISPATRA